MERRAEPELLEDTIDIGICIDKRAHKAYDVVLNRVLQSLVLALSRIAAEPVREQTSVSKTESVKLMAASCCPGPFDWSTKTLH